MTRASERFRTLVGLTPTELKLYMDRGESPQIGGLADAEFRGANTASWTRRLRMQLFIKGFEHRPDGDLLGYNRRVEQGGLDSSWSAPSDRYAFFNVHPVDPEGRDSRYQRALLLDYRAVGNPRFSPARRIRDYLVRVEPDSDDLLLGRAFVALGPFRISATYFVLERLVIQG